MATQKEKISEIASRVDELSTQVEKNEFVGVREFIESTTDKSSDEIAANVKAIPIYDTSQKYKGTEMQVDKDKRTSRSVKEGPFAFHAVSDRHVIDHISTDQAIIFENVLTNVGGAFLDSHSLFIAKVPGIYLFSTSILSFTHARSEYAAAVVKDGANLALVYGHGDAGRHDQGSVTVVTQLNTGDKVWVKILSPHDASIYGGRFTTFSGVLLHKL